MFKTVLTTLLLGFTLCAQAQTTPVGLWKTIDDETGKEKSLVRITESGGELTGKIEKLLDPTKQDAKCDKCSDARKDQPILGMTIFSGLKPEAGEPGLWSGAEILDPNKGKSYRMRLRPIDGGKKLEMRGYMGPFYRNQEWQRVE